MIVRDRTDNYNNIYRLVKELAGTIDPNVCIKEISKYSNSGVRITLTVKDSSGKYSGRSRTGRKNHAVCWHGFGKFIDLVLAWMPEAEIITSPTNAPNAQHIYSKRDPEWFDWSIGSSYYGYVMASSLCECDE